MRCALGILSLVCLLLSGCGSNTSGPAAPASSTTTAGNTNPAIVSGAADDNPVPENRMIKLTPENTTIGFVGTHAPGATDPREGTFGKFSGTAEMDPLKDEMKSISVEIDTTSLKANHEEAEKAAKLTNHLKNPDFLDVEQYPTAKFESTKIEYGEGGAHTVTGDLTLHGVTKEISFPAKMAPVPNAASRFTAEFEIDRMDFGVGDSDAGKGVERPVTIKVTIGK